MERPAPVLELVIYGDPRSQGSKSTGRAANGHVWTREYEAGKLRTWRAIVVDAVSDERHRLGGLQLRGAVVAVEFVFPTPSGHFVTRKGTRTAELKEWARSLLFARALRDVDKMQRALGDALATTGLISNDSAIWAWAGPPGSWEGPRKVYGDFMGVRLWVYDGLEVERMRAAPWQQDSGVPVGPPEAEPLKEGPVLTHFNAAVAGVLRGGLRGG